MAILTLHSTNPNFSFVISKNPETIKASGKPYQRDLRKGQLYGWFPENDPQTFKLWFKDDPARTSFSEGVKAEFNYLESSRYCSPYFPIQAISTALRDAVNNQHELDVAKKYETVAEFITKVDRPHNVRAMQAASEGNATASQQGCDTLWRWEVKGDTVMDVLNRVNLICICLAYSKYEDAELFIPMGTPVLMKYIAAMNRIDAPFYIRSRIARSLINNQEQYAAVAPYLNSDKIHIEFGDTRFQRYTAIRKIYRSGKILIDIGCGEGFYSNRLANSYDAVHAVDKDEETLNRAKSKARDPNIAKKITFHNLEVNSENLGTLPVAGSDVLLTEVVEHIPLEDAGKLILAILAKDPANLVVTTPDKSFNKNYYMGPDAMRHSDHVWEATRESFEGLVKDLLSLSPNKDKYELVVYGIGDRVGEDHTSTLAHFKRK